MTNGMSRLSMHNRPNNFNRFRSPHQTSTPAYFHSNMNQPDTQAQLAAFTPSLMSIQLPHQQSRINNQRNYYPPRSYVQNHSSSTIKTKSQPEYYVDSFPSNFSNKPSLDSNNKPKTKHVTFQEPGMTKSVFVFVLSFKILYKFSELPQNTSNNVAFSSSHNSDYSADMWESSVPMYHPPYQYNYHNQYNPYYSYPSMMNQRHMSHSRGMNMIS